MEKSTIAKANVVMYLKHMKDDLYYCMNDPNGTYKTLEPDTVTGADGDWVVQWECADDSIKKIIKINVNLSKDGGPSPENIWKSKPKKANSSGTIFQGKIKPGTPDPPIKDGYTIFYKTKDGDKEKDPTIQVPQ